MTGTRQLLKKMNPSIFTTSIQIVCQIVRDSGLSSRLPGVQVVNLTTGGATWKSLENKLPGIIQVWKACIAEAGCRPGRCLVWMTGNDIYSRLTGLASYAEETLDRVTGHARRVVAELLLHADGVLVLGPLPRLSGEVAPVKWEQTAAFHLERRLKHQLPPRVQFVPLGRQLTRKMNNIRSLNAGCAEWFRPDHTHLSPAGYERVADAPDLSIWVKIAAAQA